MLETKKIVKKKLLLVEGIDAFRFFLPVFKTYGINDVQIFDFGGPNSDLQRFLSVLMLAENFDEVETLAIARDAEQNVNATVDSITARLKNLGFDVPNNPFEFSAGPPRIGYALFPGYNVDGILDNGTLEDLCLRTVDGDALLPHSSAFVGKVHEEVCALTHIHKSKLHAFLSVKNGAVGAKLGEASKYNVWNFEHQSFEPYIQFLCSI